MFFQWIFKKPALSDKILSFQKKTNINPVLAQLLIERNIDSLDKVHEFCLMEALWQLNFVPHEFFH